MLRVMTRRSVNYELGEDCEGSGRDISEAGRDISEAGQDNRLNELRTTGNNSIVVAACMPAKIRTQHLLNTNLKAKRPD